ncbi:MAG: hypothetical protein AB7P76_12360 [Candidatus Melainabacteria bacterium]
MNLWRAMAAFYSTLTDNGCTHARMLSRELTAGMQGQKTTGKRFCPDCGDAVRLVWTLLRCRHCLARRRACSRLDGQTAPVETFCTHCGARAVRRIQKATLLAHEVPYATCRWVPDETDESVNPFTRFNGQPGVVEGQVVRSRTVTLQG